MTDDRAEVEDTTGADAAIDELAIAPAWLGEEDSMEAPPAEESAAVAAGSMEYGCAAKE